MAEYIELFMDQGADFSTEIYINNENSNTPQNLSGFIVTSQMRKSLVSINATASLVCTVSNTQLGEIVVSLDAGNTANIPAGTYFFDIKTRDTLSMVTSRLIEGIIYVTPAITK